MISSRKEVRSDYCTYSSQKQRHMQNLFKNSNSKAELLSNAYVKADVFTFDYSSFIWTFLLVFDLKWQEGFQEVVEMSMRLRWLWIYATNS